MLEFLCASSLISMELKFTSEFDNGIPLEVDKLWRVILTAFFIALDEFVTEVEELSQLLYTHYVLQFLVAGLILSLAVVGVVALTVNLNSKDLATNMRQNSRVNRIT